MKSKWLPGQACVRPTFLLDPVTEDMLIGQIAELELFQWFMRSHLENSRGSLDDASATTETAAAASTKPSSAKKGTSKKK